MGTLDSQDRDIASEMKPTTLGEDGGILSLGIFRTGTYSMTKALNILGYDRVVHGLDFRAGLAGDDATTQPWSRASWANLPFMRVLYPAGTSPPWLRPEYVSATAEFGRHEWDELLSSSHGVTDVASMYAPMLIKAYPKAKVVLCYRDPDAWFASVDETFISLLSSPTGIFVRRFVEPLAGMYTYTHLWDIFRGWFEAETAEEIRATYRERYERHYETVRNLVPPEQLLEYKLGDGWQPLCEFLGKPVPGPDLLFQG
ncbi:hypothetical protein QBC47DRAFT_154017 [Echria macrotheca]|uniref:Sulfotransferase n=1 Tax=Echria macrotheca TaxID=438768 RepID=A0AAJ0FBF8_9PEZI|nr:hypothetical protein QBC47DRAFT_154017 [Echria macrotheca]